ncbi:MAG: hypothetical protein AB1393_08425 [Candidatus Edwardsbacteria bacterium]
MKVAKDAGVDVKAYSLSEVGEELHKIINIKQDKFLKLIEDIKEKSKMLKALKGLII